MPGKLESILVDEEWISGCVSALDMNRRKQLAQLRGFPSFQKMTEVQPDIGWFMRKWIIPIRNIHGECFHAKAWTNDPAINPNTGQHYEKWTTIGFANAAAQRRQGNAIGHVFNLDWIVEWVDKQEPSDRKPWLWFVEGEFDCLMLRCFNWPATTLTIGATASMKASSELFVREFGGLASASQLLSQFQGIVLCYDADDAGIRGMQRHAALLEDMFNQINEAAREAAKGKGDIVDPLPATFVGVKAVDLRQHPQWENGDGWGKDISDLVKWSIAHKHAAAKWLKDQARNAIAGVMAISDLLGLDFNEDIGKPSIGDILVNRFKTITFSELMRIGIDYAERKGSRNEGWYHMAVTAARNGWTMDEIWYQETNDESDGLGPMLLEYRIKAVSQKLWPQKPDMPIEELRRCFERAFVDYKQTAFITDDTSNMLRLFHYFPWLRYHPVRGWLWYERTAWQLDAPRALESATQIGSLVWEEANNLAADAGNAKLVAGLKRWAKMSRSSGKVHSMLHLASGHPLSRPDEGWDVNPYYIGTPKGVFDLEKGLLLDPTASMNAYCSMTTNGNILDWDQLVKDKHEGAVLWTKIVKTWFDDEASIQMLQEIGGACLIGMLIQKMFVFESSGRSGKSLCLGAWSNALGSYSGIMLGSVLGSKSTDNSKSSAMAGLDGLRMIRIDEVGSVTIDVEMLKAITGESKLTARAMRENWSVINNIGTYIGTANGTLNLSRDVSEALRSRIVYLKWPHTFIDPRLLGKGDYAGDGVYAEDVSLGARLNEPEVATGVLSWMYAGLKRMMYRDGADSLDVHIAVTEASQKMSDDVWRENNPIRAFFDESGFFRPCQKGEDGTWISTNGLRQKMIEWARVNDPELAKDLERGPRVLAALLQKQRARGFESSKNLITGALWAADRQARAWKVPYIFVAV